jgi:hypothetical protein
MDNKRKNIEEFQCPGCVSGSDTECGNFCLYDHHNLYRCENHTAGTMNLVGKFFLGMPKGFNKANNETKIFFNDDNFYYDHLNIPVWALEKDGYLFVKQISPRINQVFVEIYKGKTFDELKDDFPFVQNVADFIDDID